VEYEKLIGEINRANERLMNIVRKKKENDSPLLFPSKRKTEEL